MGTQNSSMETRQRSIDLSDALGAYHVDLNIDSLVKAVTDLFGFVTGRKPQYRVRGGNKAENLALQNIQVCRCQLL
jgi:NAD+ synthase (glutamine-hydrolysing)